MPTLDWLNRASAFNTAARVPYRLLERGSVHAPTAPSLTARPELIEGSAASTSSARTGVFDNLLIQGDNLEALKALPPFYRGQVKCIFIDPPYNTKILNDPYEIEKRQIGELWARKSAGKCLFGQIVKDRAGVGMSSQLDALLA